MSPTDWVSALAAVFAGLAAWFAHKSAATARESLLVTQRAYIVSPSIRTINHINPSTNLLEAIEGIVVWENAGATPARSVVCNVECDFFPAGQEVRLAFKSAPDNTPRVDVGPRYSFSGSSFSVTSGDLSRLLQRQTRLFIWGSCEYFDVFDAKTPRVARFCFEAQLALDPRQHVHPNSSPPEFLKFMASASHNAAT